MKRLAIVSACFLLAACGGGSRSFNYGPPPPAPPEQNPTLRSYQPSEPEPYQPGPPPRVESAGPLKTAMVGSYMDRQEADLRQTLRGTGVLVARPGDDIVLHVRTDEIFKPNSTTLNDTGERILFQLAPVLRHFDHTSIFVAGFTDTTGTPDQNMEISRKRAYTVGGQLVKDGVPLSRLHAQGFGEEHLKIPTGDSVNEPRNRRIEIRISAQPQG
ncbi:MAG TPA: OmpA family protein [Rhizomicrobium sp.]|nr:OmpA family protein [Rhizomicrobium sp.]